MFPFEVGAGCDRVAPFLQKSQDTQWKDNWDKDAGAEGGIPYILAK